MISIKIEKTAHRGGIQPILILTLVKGVQFLSDSEVVWFCI